MSRRKKLMNHLTAECHCPVRVSNKLHLRTNLVDVRVCRSCYNNLVRLLSIHQSTLTGKLRNEYSVLGFSCYRCGRRSLGNYVFVEHVTTIKETTDQSYRIPKVKSELICQSCWKESEENRGLMITTSRDFYIPVDRDEFIPKLFGQGLKRTEKTYVVMRTDILRSIFDLVKMLPEYTSPMKLEALPSISKEAE